MDFRRLTMVATMAMSLASAGAAHAISVGELDDFSATLEGWTQGLGAGGLSQVMIIGPGGSQSYMQVQSGVGGRPKLVAFNQTAAWSGNYVSAKIAAIGIDVNNFGGSALQLRLAFGTTKGPNAGGTWFTSTSAIAVPAASGWQHIQFPIAQANLSRTAGSATYAAVMGGVATLRLLHSTTLNDQGDALTGLLGVDNIEALGFPPIPGDFNGSGRVDAADLAKWRADFGGPGSDANGDLVTDGDDFLIWQRNLGMGSSVPAATAVPEPAAATLLGVTALVGAMRRRQTH